MRRLTRLARFAWIVLAYNVLVILWGAFVSATGSGAGCGEHWPTCNGQIVPRPDRVDTLIEFTHRLSSGVALLLLIGLAVWAWRAYPAGHRVRRAAFLSFVFVIVESLLGAALVLFRWVAFDASLARVLVQPIHLLNTLLLLAAILATAWWASGGQAIQIAGQAHRLRWLVAAWLGVVAISASGSVISLGDLLALQLGERYNALVEVLVRLRLGHPAVAIGVGLYVIWLAFARPELTPNPTARRLAWMTAAFVIVQWLVGLVNVWLRVPVWTQLLHLLLADLTWIALGLWSLSALAHPAPRSSLADVASGERVSATH